MTQDCDVFTIDRIFEYSEVLEVRYDTTLGPQTNCLKQQAQRPPSTTVLEPRDYPSALLPVVLTFHWRSDTPMTHIILEYRYQPQQQLLQPARFLDPRDTARAPASSSYSLLSRGRPLPPPRGSGLITQ